MSQVQIYTADQAAELMGCSVKTVEDMARRGELPGLKPGGGWIFPAGALARRLDELAIEQAARRRLPEAPLATTVQVAEGRRARSAPHRAPALPKLVDMKGVTR
jgi:excisionase family DNA binding protein